MGSVILPGLDTRTYLPRCPRSRNFRIIIFPAVVLLLGTITSIAMIVVAGHGHQTVHEGLLSRLMYVAFGSSLVINCLVTALIVGRLYTVGRKGSMSISGPIAKQQDPYTRLILALVEGGFLYSISLVLYLTLYAVKVSSYPLQRYPSMSTELGCRAMPTILSSRRCRRLSGSRRR